MKNSDQNFPPQHLATPWQTQSRSQSFPTARQGERRLWERDCGKRIARLDDAFSGILELEASPVEGQPLQQRYEK